MPVTKLLRVLLVGAVLALALPASAVEAPALLLAEVFHGQVDVARYLVSEKLDGVRAIWDGQVLRFRGGGEVKAPKWFLEGLPVQALDGELWMGRGSFDQLSGLVRREVPDDATWRQVRYMVFELPEAPGTFAQRAERLHDIVARANIPWLQAVQQFRVADQRSLLQRMNEVVAAGGEGLMLHRADAPYETGRSDTLLKVKPWLDAEARVIGHVAGKGKFAGLMGALRLRTPAGREFSVGTGFSDALRRNPPPMGAVVTYRYRDLTNNGIPRLASFMRVRVD